eukprot:gene15280-biopygen8362
MPTWMRALHPPLHPPLYPDVMVDAMVDAMVDVTVHAMVDVMVDVMADVIGVIHLCVFLPYYHRITAVVPPLYRRFTAVVPPLYRRCTAVVPPLYRRCTAVVPPLYRSCTAVETMESVHCLTVLAHPERKQPSHGEGNHQDDNHIPRDELLSAQPPILAWASGVIHLCVTFSAHCRKSFT